MYIVYIAAIIAPPAAVTSPVIYYNGNNNTHLPSSVLTSVEFFPPNCTGNA